MDSFIENGIIKMYLKILKVYLKLIIIKLLFNLSFVKAQHKLDKEKILIKEGYFSRMFPVTSEPYKNRHAQVTLPKGIVEFSDTFAFGFHKS